jgi:threonine dehydrogenase-like Zn-dependent dehydrogenase
MRRAQWSSSGVDLVDIDPGPVPDGWVRLQVTGCGICGSDLHFYRGMRAGVLSPADFASPGHEIAGTNLDGGGGLADAVYAVEPWINCQDCPECLSGATNLCETGAFLGLMVSGGLASEVDVPSRLLHPVDAGVDAAVASLAEPWAVAVRAVHQARLTEIDERVLVLGGGTIGLLCGVAARDRVGRVGITCRYPHQAALAERFGLEAVASASVDDWATEHRPGVVIETVGGEADTMAEAVRCARTGGRVVVVGVFAAPRPTDYVQVLWKELEIVGSKIYGTVASGSEFGAAVRRMGSVSSELAALQTHHFGLDQIMEAFRIADDKSSRSVKVTIG